MNGAARPPQPEADSRKALGDAVLRYLAQRPRSMDTLDGIASWWIVHPTPLSRARLAEALDDLVDQGVLEKIDTAGRQFFRLRHPPGANGSPQDNRVRG